ncbi:site-specific integrase [Amycolatopsis sp. NPDC001319]
MFLERVRDHQLYALFHVAALLGLRRGEVVGLRWCDVDLARRTLSVVRQVVARDGRGVCLPKTDASCRVVALDRGTAALLRRLARRDPTGDWVFSHDRGRPWSPSYVSRTFRTLVSEAGLPPIRFHDLRHGAATLSLAAGDELRVVQALALQHRAYCGHLHQRAAVPGAAGCRCDSGARPEGGLSPWGPDPRGSGAPPTQWVAAGAARRGR